MTRLTRYELKLFLRDPASIIVTLVLPVGIVGVFALILKPAIEADPIATYFPAAAITLGLAQLGLNLMPTTLAGYREKGILRRMATTPIPPSRLLLAQLAVGVLCAVASLVTVVAGVLAFGFEPPGLVVAALATFALGVLAIFAIGMLVAAVAPSTRVATGIGVSLFFLGIAFGGVFTPAETMPEFVLRVSDYTPVGAFMQALRASWGGDWPQPLHLAVPAVYALGCGLLAARFFRWE